MEIKYYSHNFGNPISETELGLWEIDIDKLLTKTTEYLDEKMRHKTSLVQTNSEEYFNFSDMLSSRYSNLLYHTIRSQNNYPSMTFDWIQTTQNTRTIQHPRLSDLIVLDFLKNSLPIDVKISSELLQYFYTIKNCFKICIPSYLTYISSIDLPPDIWVREIRIDLLVRDRDDLETNGINICPNLHVRKGIMSYNNIEIPRPKLCPTSKISSTSCYSV